MARARVLLLDDDASVRCFVALALAELPIDLVACEHISAARAALRAAPCALLITDLVLSGESGVDFLRELRQEPGLLAGARVLVFSASSDPSVRDRLAGLPVWRILPKPASLARLQAEVHDALTGSPIPATGPAAAGPGTTAAVETAGRAEATAMAQHFGGDAALFHAFRATCWSQIPADLATAEAAMASGDVAAVRRVGHSLKTVLQLIGRPDLAALARDVDEAATTADWARLRPHWDALRRALDQAAA